jgi:hypothetical protein
VFLSIENTQKHKTLPAVSFWHEILWMSIFGGAGGDSNVFNKYMYIRLQYSETNLNLITELYWNYRIRVKRTGIKPEYKIFVYDNTV